MHETFTHDELENVYISGGFAHPDLTNAVAASVGAEVGPVQQKIHPNGEIYSRFENSVRGKDVFIIQSHIGNKVGSVNDAIMQHCLLIDAARSSSAREITAIAPYLAYGRQDRKVKGREPIGIRVVLDQLAAAGADRIVTVDMHSPQAQAIFRGPFDHLTAQPLLRTAMREEVSGVAKETCVVVAPDAGAVKLSEQHRQELHMGMFVMAKMRDPDDNQKIRRDQVFPDAEGKICLLFDDMVDTAGTLVSAAEVLKKSGAEAVYVAATHGILSDPALNRLSDAPIDKILVSDTFTMDEATQSLGDKLRVVSIAPMIGQAIIEIVRDGSISNLFRDENHR
jgi:ribose-phosphate pyrophosphokinase